MHPVPEKFLKPYSPADHENVLYKRWEDSGFFNPDICIEKGVTEKDAEPYSIVLPPPNVTGTLHMGHAAMLAIQDILIRFERMRGKRTLWIPGTDHAAIATASKVEKEIYKKEKKNRHDLGREEFLKRVDAFAQESHDTIENQLKKMGSSLDWSREAFTLDEARHRAVNTAFKNMYDAGLIYRAARVVNWDPKGQTTISDDEIVYKEENTTLYTFRYSADFPISISTTRPETKVGDTAVAVHPDDKRYQQYIGQTFDVEFCGASLSIKIIADESIDKDFGTGALGVTPAHSQIDFEIAQRHNLSLKQVINEYAKMTAGNVEGLKVKNAREKIVEWLREQKLLEDEEEIVHNVSTAERTGAVVEPLPKLQWWIDTEKEFTLEHSEIDGIESGSKTTLKTIMRTVVENGQIKLNPERFDKTYFHWVDNLRPWCISRQIWYGHRVPVWYCSTKQEPNSKTQDTNSKPAEEHFFVSLETPSECPVCKDCTPEQDPDTLDTWFSSGLWTFSTLGWPDETADLATYHPTDVLETGYDILFFWVARMILMTGFHLGTIPFKSVCLHGLVRDAKGQKMSKSLGNIIDPLDMIEKYGADATRLSLIIGAAAGNDSKLSEDKVRGYKNFANKVWNISRFVLESTEDIDLSSRPDLPEYEQNLIDEFHTLSTDITSDLENFRLYLAGEKIYHYLWHRFADELIEESKSVFSEGDEAARAARGWALYAILADSLKLLHPFMPFVTEAIWQELPENTNKELLMVTAWPDTISSNK